MKTIPLSDVALDQVALILSDAASVGDLEPFVDAPITQDEAIVPIEENENFYESNRNCGEHGC